MKGRGREEEEEVEEVDKEREGWEDNCSDKVWFELNFINIPGVPMENICDVNADENFRHKTHELIKAESLTGKTSPGPGIQERP